MCCYFKNISIIHSKSVGPIGCNVKGDIVVLEYVHKGTANDHWFILWELSEWIKPGKQKTEWEMSGPYAPANGRGGGIRYL